MLVGFILCLEFYSAVFRFTGVHVLRTTVNHGSCYHVVGFEIEKTQTKSEAVVEKIVAECEFIVRHALGFQIFVCGTEHVEFANGRISKSLAHHCAYLRIVVYVERKSALRHEFCSRRGVIVNAQAGIKCYERQLIRTKIQLTGYFVLLLVSKTFVFAGGYYLVPCLTSEMLIVNTECNPVSFKQ